MCCPPTCYLDFARRYGPGPDDVLPRVLVTVPNPVRATALRQLVALLAHPAATLFYITIHEDAATYMGQMIRT